MGRTNGRGTPRALPEPLLIRRDEAAALSGVCDRTLRKLIATGVLTGIRPAGDGKTSPVLLRRADVLAWIEAGCPKTPAATRRPKR